MEGALFVYSRYANDFSSRSEGRRPERSEVNKFVGPSRPERS